MARPPNCGKPLTIKLPQLFKSLSAHQGNDLGDGNNVLFATMSDPQPSSFDLEKVQRLDVGRSAQ